MRRMITDNDIVKTVNDAIEGGEIEVGGGTQLYEHFFSVKIADEESQEATLWVRLITLSPDSLVDHHVIELCGNYISGFVYNKITDPFDPQGRWNPIMGIADGSDLFYIYFMDNYGETKHYKYYDSLTWGLILSDTVTEL